MMRIISTILENCQRINFIVCEIMEVYNLMLCIITYDHVFFPLCLGSVLNCWTFSVSLSGPSAEQMLADLQPSSSHVLLVRHQQDALMWQHDGNVNTPKHHAKQ